ncbi:MAG: polyamine aminopropyltransferase [Candidatus Kapabacteria bacterium]|nr:polyamine aminopropyltransferase [Candidatus Kapabacteria bacterium]MCS7170341.1 polyamine aminopropyltransferase [Candidatus Kapabacteria bacterium]MDW7996742.1 polyamine aminopropyltransferase [Bacteroidota bacterium]MDW8225429.1 polyamine aminopropyltransferase [Bacteroidota bacterium]
MASGIWIVDRHTQHLEFHYRVEEVLYSGHTAYQRVDIVRAPILGKALFLDGRIQSAQVDEFIYHEALVHPALLTHPHPQRVLIMGGGEGATLREVLHHPLVHQATMVDIDQELVELCNRLLPEWHQGCFRDHRTQLHYGDARAFVEAAPEAAYEVIISDLTEPLEGGPSVMLFTVEFYQKLAQCLTPDGIFAAQAGSADPVYPDFVASLSRTLLEVFPIVRVLWAFVYSFQLPWAFVIASKHHDPLDLTLSEIKARYQDRDLQTRYYSPQLHAPLFALPPYLEELLRLRGHVISDQSAFVWQA